MKHLPNLFSIIRILCSPAIFILLIMSVLDQTAMGLYMAWAFGLFVFAACTDWVDGTLARALNATSKLGAKLDLLADKLLVGITLLGIIISNLLVMPKQLWPIVIAIGAFLLAATSLRDYLVTRLRVKGVAFGLDMPASFLAKSKTAVIMSGIGLYLAAWPFDNAELLTLGAIVTLIGALLSLFTGFQYLTAYQKAKAKFQQKI